MFDSTYTVTPVYLSLNFSPYLLQIDFENEINTMTIKVYIKCDSITFCFEKRIHQMWKNIVLQDSKQAVFQRRQKSLEKLFELREKLDKERKKAKKQRVRTAEKRLWKEENAYKQTIQDLEKKEKHQASINVNSWLQSKLQKVSNKSNTINNQQTESTSPSTNMHLKSTSTPVLINTKTQHDQGCNMQAQTESKSSIEDEKSDFEVNIPPIRKMKHRTIKTQFSKWDYVVPARENVKPPEFTNKKFAKFLDKRNKQQTTAASNNKSNCNIDDTQPKFILDQAHNFFEHKNFQSAINKYKQVINLINTSTGDHDDDSFDILNTMIVIQTLCCLTQCYISQSESICHTNTNNDKIKDNNCDNTRKLISQNVENGLLIANQCFEKIQQMKCHVDGTIKKSENLLQQKFHVFSVEYLKIDFN